MRSRKTRHQRDVEDLLYGIGHPIPRQPQLATDERLLLYARLLIEEAMEYVEAANVTMFDKNGYPINFKDLKFHKTDLGGDLVKIADGFADTMVIATGGLALCGIADKSLLREVDANNLLKLKNGKKHPETGKFIKPKDHPPPDIKKVLKEQGWEE